MAHKVVTFGEIMLRLSTPGYARFGQASSFQAVYGGGEANVAVSLAQMGLAAEHVTRFPTNDLGKAATQQLQRYGVSTKHILFGGDRLGLYFLETGAISRPSKIVYDRANSAFSQIQPGMVDWEEVLQEAAWFHWNGISPAISEGAAQTCLEAIRVANRLGVRVSADVNARKNLWNYGKKAADVMPELVEGCDLIMASAKDAKENFGIRAEEGQQGKEAERAVYQQVFTQFPRLRLITNTRRGSVSASHNTLTGVLYDGERLLTSPTHDLVPIVDRIGGGDAYFAGLIYGLLTYPDDHQRALNFAVAASALKHTIEGDANLATAEEVEALAQGDSSGKIRR